jgi:hydrogenase maturation protein HypF
MKITVYGVVQGVGFRPTVYRVAKAMGLKGFVLNNGSNAEIHVDRDAERFLTELRTALPALARIDSVEIEETDEKLGEFKIVRSHEGARVSLIPTDTAICKNCMSEFNGGKNRRHLYQFTNCTECGARFTVIEDLPFDRTRTSMSDFPMCPECMQEYSSPEDRRFHAQTISCPRCGPKYRLYDKNQKIIRGDAFKTFAGMIDGGKVGLLKGWGGMHIICTFDNASRLRKVYRRGNKPYAVMMKDLETTMKYARVSDYERTPWTSWRRSRPASATSE